MLNLARMFKKSAPMQAVSSGRIIAIDFDGCLCRNAWPGIGAPNRSVIREAKLAKATGAELILWTCRSGEALREAVDWCRAQGLLFDAVNENLPRMIVL